MLLVALFALFALLAPHALVAQAADTAHRLDAGRFTIVAYPRDLVLARNLLAQAQRNDTFPGLARPQAKVVIAIAPDSRRFRELAGSGPPEWGAAFAFPESNRILMQGSAAGANAGDPFPVLRHELAHLALHEAMGDLPPRWFDEGYASYAAGESGRDEFFATNVAIVWGGMPGLEELDDWFFGGGQQAEAAYALSHRAVTDLAAIDRVRGLTLFFRYWRESRRMDQAVRRAYGLTLASFEEQWQTGVRRQYGLLALFADLTLVTAVTMAPLIPLWLFRRRRDRRRLAAMRVAEAAEESRRREDATLLAILAPDRGGAADGASVRDADDVPERPRGTNEVD